MAGNGNGQGLTIPDAICFVVTFLSVSTVILTVSFL